MPVVAISTGTTLGQRTPIAHDIEYLVWRALAREAKNEGRLSLDEVVRANEIFGPSFFDPGHQTRPTRDEVITILSRSEADSEMLEKVARSPDPTRHYGSAVGWAHDYFYAHAREAFRLFGWEPDLAKEAARMEDQGRLDRAVKLILDAEHSSPEHNSYLGRLHHLFLRLDWRWAAGLASLRS